MQADEIYKFGGMIMFLAAIWSIAPPVDAANAPKRPITADINVKLDRDVYSQGDEISGKVTILFRRSPGASAQPGKTVNINGPVVLFRTDPLTLPTNLYTIELKSQIASPIRLDHKYHSDFRVMPSRALLAALQKDWITNTGDHSSPGQEPKIPLFSTGIIRFRITVTSSPTWQRHMANTIYGRFFSEWNSLSVTKAKPNTCLSGKEVRKIMKRSADSAKGYLIEYYDHMGWPLKDLEPFKLYSKDTLNLGDHTQPLFFHRIRANTSLKLTNVDSADIHTFQTKGAHLSLASEASYDTGNEERILKVMCSFHRKEYGWILIDRPENGARPSDDSYHSVAGNDTEQEKQQGSSSKAEEAESGGGGKTNYILVGTLALVILLAIAMTVRKRRSL